MNDLYIGIDVGSVSTNVVALDKSKQVFGSLYLRTMGRPIWAVQEGLRRLLNDANGSRVRGIGTTGSGRQLAAVMVGADAVKNEITAHAVGAAHFVPGVRTIFEIGGQDSKLIILQNGVVVDFSMNTVCAAGTGSFLDQQALRLKIPIEEFGDKAISVQQGARIAGRCGVFAESDMIHKQQMGYPTEEIIAGLCEALARNYLTNLGKGKQIESPVVFQGGVAANKGMRRAFEKILNMEIAVPPHHDVMGAVGAALLASEADTKGESAFKGMDFVLDGQFANRSYQCSDCPNQCEVVSIEREGQALSYWGDRCRKWESTLKH
ncbi:MAG: acyl-CoA dehydratase activase [Candidatus Saccharibacteria bacterium]